MSIIAQAASSTTGTLYTLVVTSGSGDGVYLAGSLVTITADAPSAGQIFDQWTGATVAVPTNGSTTITMTGNFTVTATYVAADPATYTLAVVNGTGDGNYVAGHVQAISADAAPTGQVFDVWTGATVADSADPTTTLTMPASAATVTANYVDGPFYALVVNSGSGDGSYLAGTVVTITAAAPAAGDVFDVWTGDTVASASSASTTITMPAAAQAVTATYATVPATYTLAVVSGTGGGNYAAASVNPIVANAPSAGRVFSAWTGGGAAVANPSDSSTTVTMPAAALTVTATYVDGPFFTLTVNSGTGDGSYLAGAVRTIVADAPATGKVFSVWTGGSVASASSPSTTVTMPASNVTVTATYVNNPVTYTLVVTAGSGDGNYSAGDVVAIVAEAPSVGKVFSQWTGGTVANAFLSTTTVTMPAAAVSLTATYINSTGLPIIPGAWGFGMETRAAYGGGVAPTVYRVQNLNDSGSGSLRAALIATDPRVVIFETSGTIVLNSDIYIRSPYLTIAAQTAPSPGVTLRGYGIWCYTHDVLVEGLRIRPGDVGSVDTGQGFRAGVYEGGGYNLVISNCSVSWTCDEGTIVAFTSAGDFGARSANVTFWHCIMSEALNFTPREPGSEGKGIAVNYNSKQVSLLQNLYISDANRLPLVKGGTSVYVANNEFYNWAYNPPATFVDPVEDGIQNGPFLVSLIGNHYRTGPSWDSSGAYMSGSRYAQPGSRLFLSDNLRDASGGTLNEFIVIGPDGINPTTGVTTPPITVSGYTPSAASTVQATLQTKAGARPTDRDSVDVRVCADVIARTGSALLTSQDEVGGWPSLAVNTRALTLPSSPNTVTPSGYTVLEEWLHGYAASVGEY